MSTNTNLAHTAIPFLDNIEVDLSNELEQILDREQMLWLQKSRENWIVERDRNTKYFHIKTIIRRRRNKILKLRQKNGDWIEEQGYLRDHICNYYKSLFKENITNRDYRINTNTWYPELNGAVIQQLRNFVSSEEVETAIFAMGSLKAPGEDGLPAGFYKDNWSIVGA
ncbi:uncharacterized protein [Arachis hypogaea]|uniref:uncharacterized protein n=1 Tax=Arachis hypogaea TaxID=3818 RepID=UPI003B21055C